MNRYDLAVLVWLIVGLAAAVALIYVGMSAP